MEDSYLELLILQNFACYTTKTSSTQHLSEHYGKEKLVLDQTTYEHVLPPVKQECLPSNQPHRQQQFIMDLLHLQ